MLMFRAALVAAVVGSLASVSLAAGPVDAVGPQDRLRLKVLEWLPAKGEYREWAAVGGEYTVAPDLTIAVPFVGNVSVAAQSLSALSGTVADALQKGLSLPTRPEVIVDVAARTPVYVIGGVETPGKVEFTPGLTAMQAVALAGGFYRGGGGSMRLERDTINAESDLSEARDAAIRLRARLVRLEAELAGSDTLGGDPSKNSPEFAAVLAEEQGIFDVRSQARLSQLDSAKSRRELAVEQLTAIDEKAASLDRQIESTRKQLADVQKLVDKGLTLASRQYELERTLSDLEGRLLDLQIGRLSTTLAINEAERDQLDILTDFRTTVANELQATRSQLAEKTIAIARASALLHESSVIAPDKLMDRAGGMSVAVHFLLTRKTGDHSATVEISKDEVIEAGDTIQVQMDIDAPLADDQTNSTE